ncbi:MAG: hypothetical protein COA43_02500 [Robiginitomaculum sp.]|nr:MAG: hypothetical protein COA43_02500 [Robiginitomaculum sp.]
MRIVLLILAFCFAGCGNFSKKGPNLDVIRAEKPARNLSAYGLFEKNSGGMLPVKTVVPYILVNPLFTDYALKARFIFTPKGKAARYNPEDVFTFPVGTVLIKNFGYAPDLRKPNEGQYLIETRLLIHKAKGWVAIPYVWNAEQTEAVYAPVGKRVVVETIAPDGIHYKFEYSVPNKNQCKTCHQSGHDLIPIGPKARNLNHNQQLEKWAELGILTGLPEHIPTLPNMFDPSAPLGARARAYLDINCAHCHKAEGSASNSGLWLDWAEKNKTRLGFLKHPTAAGRGAGDLKLVIEPGSSEGSILSFRMTSNAAGIAMPELGRTLQHIEGVALINEWIESLEPTP